METLKKIKRKIHMRAGKGYFNYKCKYYLDEYLLPNTAWNPTDKILHANDENAPQLLYVDYGLYDFVIIEVAA